MYKKLLIITDPQNQLVVYNKQGWNFYSVEDLLNFQIIIHKIYLKFLKNYNLLTVLGY